jgi:alpha-L-glutamate ligase-like protein
MFKLYKALRKKGVLSLNERNAGFVLQYNDRKRFPIVDDKVKTKRLAMEAGIAVPELYGVIENEHQALGLHTLLQHYPDFVIKPAHGAGGDGIVVITGRVKDRYRKANGHLISKEELSYHVSCTLSGAYSLGGHPDHVLIEHRVIKDSVFEAVSYEGVPDLRIIVLFGYPVMAMARLPTRQSDGKANLHQGAIGVGVDLGQGKTIGGVHLNEAIDVHPDTLNTIANIQVPYWHEILMIAAKAYELTGLGYLGVDIVLDEKEGPLMLELNARPGLNIQIANREGLLHRLEKVKSIHQEKNLAPLARVTYSQTYFSAGRDMYWDSLLTQKKEVLENA